MEEIRGHYTYKGNKYAVLGECKMKVREYFVRGVPYYGEWGDGVVYIRDGQLYTREVEDFLSKFKKVEDGEL